MPLLSPNEAYERFKRDGRNSSHFVWFLDETRYFEASNGWIFGYRQFGSVLLHALEPLIPGAPTRYSPDHGVQFSAAWKELDAAVRPSIAVFVSVYEPFLSLLRQQGFQGVKVGHEPWIELEHCIPRGNSGKGVRSARNKALRSGLTVVEWPPDSIASEPAKRSTIERLLARWNDSRLIHLTGFMNAFDPFAHALDRRYFVVTDRAGRAFGYLIATPIPGINSYFLEDMVIGHDSPKGTGELLMLEAMVALRDSGVRTASMGVVSLSGSDGPITSTEGLPATVRRLTTGVSRLARGLYNFDGLETFRKRFNPSVWENIYLAVKIDRERTGLSDTAAWLKALGTVAWAFKPRLRPSWTWLAGCLANPWRKHPVTWSIAAISLSLFALVNRFGELPEGALTRFAFVAQAPLWEWLHRSVVSDFLYFDRPHFVGCLVPLLFLIRWTENTHRREFVVVFIVALSILDDFVNYAFVIMPFNYLQPRMFENLIAVKDVGGSLWLATLLGLQLCQLKKNREILFAGLCLVMVFGLVFRSEHMTALVLNLNHFLFLTVGYMVGKLEFELERRNSRAVARAKPPEARCVLPQR